MATKEMRRRKDAAGIGARDVLERREKGKAKSTIRR